MFNTRHQQHAKCAGEGAGDGSHAARDGNAAVTPTALADDESDDEADREVRRYHAVWNGCFSNGNQPDAPPCMSMLMLLLHTLTAACVL